MPEKRRAKPLHPIQINGLPNLTHPSGKIRVTLMLTESAVEAVSKLGEAPGSTSSRQLVEQCLRLVQIGGVEPLGEPAVNRR
jgi:hypothetical protein